MNSAFDALTWGWPYAAAMLRQLCVVTTLAMVIFRLPWLNRALGAEGQGWLSRVLLIALFSAVAIVDDRTGLVIDSGSGQPVERPAGLGGGDAIIDLRDMIATAAGLCGGVWIGLGVGLVTGLHRAALGSFVGVSAGAATVLLGLLGGWLHHAFPGIARQPWRAAAVGLAATLLQRLVILLFSTPFAVAWQLGLIIFLPKLVTNVAGCSLFALILRTLENDRQALAAKGAEARAAQADRDRLATRAELDRQTLLRQEAEIRALQAQVEPHFLFNTLNAIKALIRLDPDRARAYLVKLGAFFQESLGFSNSPLIPLEQEIAHLRNYLDFQQLRFEHRLVYEEDIDPAALGVSIPPRTLMTLTENALIHGQGKQVRPLRLMLRVERHGDGAVVSLTDDGIGVSAERLAQLGRQPVDSLHGSGTGLFRCREILQRTCGEGAHLSFTRPSEQGFTARVLLPGRAES